jgi:DNA-binding NarL/FixJ family response regulator
LWQRLETDRRGWNWLELASDIVHWTWSCPVWMVGGRRQAASLLPDIKVIILAGTEVDDPIFDLLAAGVEGYVLKNIEPADLVRTIRLVADGEAFYIRR